MVVSDHIGNIMGGIETTGDVRLHNQHRKLKQRFDIVKKLGQGTYGKVQLGINKETGQEVAIKTIRKCKIETEADLIRIRREIQIMSSVRHPNIIHIYEVFENREKMVLVMEYAAGGELYDYLSERKILTEDEARRLFRQIATAVYYCHKHKICHRDLKLENILLDEIGNAKIADFGLSNVFSYSSLLSTFCGSPLYASPEIVQGTPYVGPEVDCWSLGVLLYTLVYGAMPFDGSNFKRLVKQISLADYFEPKNPSSASPLIADMLNVNPANRANIQSICSHWWINETYSEICLNVAEELARRTPVRLDLLLSLTTPVVHCENKVGMEKASDIKTVLAQPKKPVRSQSLDNIPPSVVLSKIVPPPLPETKAIVTNNRKSKAVQDERVHSKIRRKRTSNRSRELNSQQIADENAKPDMSEVNGGMEAQNALVLLSSSIVLEKKFESTTCSKPKHESVDRRKSNIFDGVEKLNVTSEKPRSASPKKISPERNLGEPPQASEKQVYPMTDSQPGSPEKSLHSSAIVPSDDPFPLTSSIALNKLAESALHDEPEFHFEAHLQIDKHPDEKIGGSPELTNNQSIEANTYKAATLPRRRTSRAEIHLIPPKSFNKDEKSDENSSKCFTLLSTKRKQPDHASSTQLDTADSLSSDEDDNFQLLTAENLFSTLLSRVRSLTRRINEDEMRSSNFTCTLLAKNRSLFDNLPNRRSSETRTLSRSENVPWRRSMINNIPKRADSIETSRYTRISEESLPWSVARPECSSQLVAHQASTRRSLSRLMPSTVETATTAPCLDVGVHTGSASSGCQAAVPLHEPVSSPLPAAATRKSEARQKLSDILAKLGRSSPAAAAGANVPPKLNYSRSLPTNALQPARPADPAAEVTTVGFEDGRATHTSRQVASVAGAGEGKPPPRRSRFLRPDFFDTPRENSKYVIKNETVRAFRERSLSRQRDLSRNRSHESFPSGGGAAAADRGSSTAATATTAADYRCGQTCLPADRSRTADYLPESKRSGRVDSASRDRPWASSTAACKSTLLQNELENEIRKTKTMFSKLNGLVVAMNNTENQYRYGREANELRTAAENVDNRGDPPAKVTVVGRRRRDWAAPPPDSDASTAIAKADAPFDRLSLLEKKLSYFRKLRNQDRVENVDKDAQTTAADACKSATLLVAAVENDAKTVSCHIDPLSDASSVTSRSLPEEADSDTWSTLSDGTESHVPDDVNDRIRRRSFYSRFNIYRQKSTSTPHCVESLSSSSYARSLSARSRQVSTSSAVNKPK